MGGGGGKNSGIVHTHVIIFFFFAARRTHPSLERLPDWVSIAHVSKYPENDNAGLEPVHSSLGGGRGGVGVREGEGGGEDDKMLSAGRSGVCGKKKK